MWYNNNYRRPPRMRRRFFFPFVIPFIFLVSMHSFNVFFLTLLVMGVVALIATLVTQNANAGRNSYRPPMQNQAPPNPQDYQNPYYQPYQSPDQATSYYQPYRQGYQVQQPQAASADSAQDVAADQYQRSTAEQYEQPLANYPEPMPPMQQ
ncbi:hypothetical protein [Ktedonobacter racemifer]|uniref:Uncharacterized protein n=1 Tax=Ktedonobacter racemifer DSM 44963 TaxID=485913 RepID=D6TMU6_KTERA|nr:hypothetical protein [Ktedonobacter racemifer]EFH87096.1 hypothetical protein Krac_8420 [Ktedonobacter racemifer DSM 44963]